MTEKRARASRGQSQATNQTHGKRQWQELKTDLGKTTAQKAIRDIYMLSGAELDKVEEAQKLKSRQQT